MNKPPFVAIEGESYPFSFSSWMVGNRYIHYLLYLSVFGIGISLSSILIYGPLIMFREGASFVEIPLLFAVPSLLSFLSLNIWGVVFDRFRGIKLLLMVTFITFALCFIVLKVFVTPLSLLIAFSISNLFFTASIPASRAYITLSMKGREGEGIGLLLLFDSLGWASGSFILGILFSERFLKGYNVGYRDFFLILGLFFIFCFVLTLLLMRKSGSVPKISTWYAQPFSLRKLHSDLFSLYSDRRVLHITSIFFLFVTSTYLFFSFYSVYIVHYLGGYPGMIGISVFVTTISGALLLYIFGRIADRFGRRPVLIFTMVSHIFVYLLITISKNPLFTVVVFSFPLYPALRISATSLISDLTEKGKRGGGMGIVEGANSLAMIAGPIFGGIMAERFGMGVLPFLSLLITLFGGYVTILFLKRYRKEFRPC